MYEILRGLRVHRVGSHTPGLQIVTVQTRCATVVLAADAAHFYRNLERRQPVQTFNSLPQTLAAFETIEALPDIERIV